MNIVDFRLSFLQPSVKNIILTLNKNCTADECSHLEILHDTSPSCFLHFSMKSEIRVTALNWSSFLQWTYGVRKIIDKAIFRVIIRCFSLFCGQELWIVDCLCVEGAKGTSQWSHVVHTSHYSTLLYLRVHCFLSWHVLHKILDIFTFIVEKQIKRKRIIHRWYA